MIGAYGHWQEPENWYDTAQICRNGHLINDSTVSNPQNNKNFCETCGEPTINQCQHCNTPIQGYEHNGINSWSYTVPRFCRECGKMYPWIAVRMEAARELVNELNLSEEEKEDLKRSMKDLMQDSPRTQVASVKFKRLAAKAGTQAASMLRDVLVDVLSETAKKLLLPQ